MKDVKQELSNKYAELGAITEQLAIVNTKQQQITKIQNELLQKIQELKAKLQEDKDETKEP